MSENQTVHAFGFWHGISDRIRHWQAPRSNPPHRSILLELPAQKRSSEPCILASLKIHNFSEKSLLWTRGGRIDDLG